MSGTISEAPTDPVEKLLHAFAVRHSFNLASLREIYTDFIIRNPQAFAAGSDHVAPTEAFLAALEKEISSGKIVMSSVNARNGFSRAMSRRNGAGRKQASGGGRLHTRQERKELASKLKEYRRKQ